MDASNQPSSHEQLPSSAPVTPPTAPPGIGAFYAVGKISSLFQNVARKFRPHFASGPRPPVPASFVQDLEAASPISQSRNRSTSNATPRTPWIECILSFPFTMFLSVLFVITLVGLLSIIFPGVAAGSIEARDTQSPCACGYTINIGADASPYAFTDLMESDFLHIGDVSDDTDWQRQNYSVTAEAGRGPFGMDFTTDGIISNPISDASVWSGPGENGGDPGVELIVRGGTPADGNVDVAQLNSVREDMLWGSYRAGIKVPSVKGTCSALFWYHNDSQEIDMEFLSAQFNPDNGTFPVNLVLQSKESVAQGFNAKGSGNFVTANLPFDPTKGFHEYRMDFVPGKVIYYADGQELATLNTTSDLSGNGHMILSQWSNGNPKWSFGPPTEDAVMLVSYVKAYFNSTDPARQEAQASRCVSPDQADAFCPIPGHVAASENNVSGSNGTFFTDNGQAEGQIFYKKSDGHRILEPHSNIATICKILIGVFFAILF